MHYPTASLHGSRNINRPAQTSFRAEISRNSLDFCGNYLEPSVVARRYSGGPGSRNEWRGVLPIRFGRRRIHAEQRRPRLSPFTIAVRLVRIQEIAGRTTNARHRAAAARPFGHAIAITRQGNDFVAAWTKVMNADRYDLLAG
ncbi:MAG: hypothetical protein J0I98_21550 [Mesorhizobium sp.]|nr:hypothetical protein [Mesorhizobium sp.]MBN9245368.1 hypothetical protein [Mesorhizobium sp.]